MHAAIQKLLDEHANPTHASTQAARDQLGPIINTLHAVQHQMLVYQERVHEIEMAPHDPAYDTKLELLHQTLGNAKIMFEEITRLSTLLTDRLRTVGADFAQLDRYMGEYKKHVASLEAAR